MTMDAAVLHTHGLPVFDQFAEPVASAGQLVVEVKAAAVNPVDLMIASGRFYIKPAELPCVVGTDGVGVLDDGRRVYFESTVAPYGAAAQRALVPEHAIVEVPDGLDSPVAAALGNAGLAAWLSLKWSAELTRGETVLVLGATGAVGRLAIQIARLLGASRVIAAGRSEAGLKRALELGAEHAIKVGSDESLSVTELREASGAGVDVIIDLLWGEPAALALQATAPGARLIQVGQAAGPASPLDAATVRSRRLEIRGYANYHAPPELRVAAYRQLTEFARDGQLTVDVEGVPLADVEQAWKRQQQGAGHKLVLVP